MNLERSTCLSFLFFLSTEFLRLAFSSLRYFRFDKCEFARRAPLRIHLRINFSPPCLRRQRRRTRNTALAFCIYIGARPEFRQLLPMPPPIATNQTLYDAANEAARAARREKNNLLHLINNQSINQVYLHPCADHYSMTFVQITVDTVRSVAVAHDIARSIDMRLTIPIVRSMQNNRFIADS